MKDNIVNYLNAMHQAKCMLEQGIIDIKDYKKIESKMAKKYGLNSISLYRQNELISEDVRAIYMIPKGGEEDGNSKETRK